MTKFYYKRWYVGVAAGVITGLSLFGLGILIPMYFGWMTDASGESRAGEGTSGIITCSILLAVGIVMIFAFIAKSKPLLILDNSSISLNLVGLSEIDNIPMVPGLLRVFYLTISGRGCQSELFACPFDKLRKVEIIRNNFTSYLILQGDFRSSKRSLNLFELNEALFEDHLQKIKTKIEEKTRIYNDSASHI